MRFLVACPRCKRQFDAARLEVGSLFHCLCGEKIKVPPIEAKDATVVRCSSCGGPRQKEAVSCEYCRADFTLHERDIHTVCSSCMSRVSDRARYCHHCGTPVLPEGTAGSESKQVCPACERRTKLNSRELGSPPVSMLECPRCAGVWLGQETFRTIVERAREVENADPGISAALDRHYVRSEKAGIRYRKCPVCQNMMNRRNYGRRSGIIIDACKSHGIWFDANELDSILRWIHQGGQRESDRRELDEARAAAVRDRFKIDLKNADRAAGSHSPWIDPSGGGSGSGFLGILGSLFDF